MDATGKWRHSRHPQWPLVAGEVHEKDHPSVALVEPGVDDAGGPHVRSMMVLGSRRRLRRSTGFNTSASKASQILAVLQTTKITCPVALLL